MENEEILLQNVNEKFANLRNTCPGMDKDIYVLTDYIATIVNEELVPQGLILQLALLSSDIEKGKSSLEENPLPAAIVNNKKKHMALLTHLPTVIDKIADKKFAKEFRKLSIDILGDEIPIIEKKEYNPISDYPENIQAAVKWWANKIQEPPEFNTDNLTPNSIIKILQGQSIITPQKLNIFKETLARNIKIELDRYHYSTLSVDNTPCQDLKNAGDAAGINSMYDFPWRTKMNIEEDKIEVYSPGKSEIIWIKDKNIIENKSENKDEVLFVTFAKAKTEEKSEGKGKTKRKVK